MVDSPTSPQNDASESIAPERSIAPPRDDDRDVSERPSTNVIRAVAEVKDVAPTEFQPLYEVIEPAALDALVGPAVEGSTTVSFYYAGCSLTVYPDGRAEASTAAVTP
jgi:hypothetical protein